MLLSIDIGNTTISLAVLREDRVQRLWSIVTVLERPTLEAQLDKTLAHVRRRYPKLSSAVICSVVPKITPLVRNHIQERLKIRSLIIGKDIKVPLKNLYRNPRQVGQDRLVCAYAAMKLYGAPAIVIDLGTAITLDVVSRQEEYLGGIIVPGIRLSAESLFKKTAMLPLTRIKMPRTLIGKDTEGSILSGLFYGYGALCSGLVKNLSREVQGNPKVVMTGGYAKLLKQYIPTKVTAIEPYLVHQGIALLATV